MHRKDLLSMGYKSKGKWKTKYAAKIAAERMKKNKQVKTYKISHEPSGMWEVYGK